MLSSYALFWRSPLTNYILFLFKALRHELSLKDADLKELLEKGNKLVEDASPSQEVQAIAETLSELQGEWDRLKEETAEREGRLATADLHAQHFNEHLEKMVMWLNMTEEKLNNLKPDDLDIKDIAQTLRDLQVSCLFGVLLACLDMLAWWFNDGLSETVCVC